MENKEIYCVGIKGTGVAALAELLHQGGNRVSGSDCADVFYTDAILRELGIPYWESFAPEHIGRPDLVIHSAAYTAENNAELAAARAQGIRTMKYPEALGAYSALFDSTGVAGVHGKTTTTALTGALLRGAGLPAQVLAGSAVSAFGGRSTLNRGNKYFVAETCEYRRHFLHFHPRRVILTAIESDHQDYYPDYASIFQAFLEYLRLLPSGGELIYCADDPGAAAAAAALDREGREVRLIPYGFTAPGFFRIRSCSVRDERLTFELAGLPGAFSLRIPGRHNALNAAGSLALTTSLVRAEWGDWTSARLDAARSALEAFQGSKRRSEILGEAGGVLFMDDYGHHPTAISATIKGLREFYPRRRLVLSFMSHTYTRTAALLDEFARALTGADLVILHKIYASAREVSPQESLEEALFERARQWAQTSGGAAAELSFYYVAEPLDAVPLVETLLRPGDLFITMGAGDNWKLGEAVLRNFLNFLNKEKKK